MVMLSGVNAEDFNMIIRDTIQPLTLRNRAEKKQANKPMPVWGTLQSVEM